MTRLRKTVTSFLTWVFARIRKTTSSEVLKLTFSLPHLAAKTSHFRVFYSNIRWLDLSGEKLWCESERVRLRCSWLPYFIQWNCFWSKMCEISPNIYSTMTLTFDASAILSIVIVYNYRSVNTFLEFPKCNKLIGMYKLLAVTSRMQDASKKLFPDLLTSCRLQAIQSCSLVTSPSDNMISSHIHQIDTRKVVATW